MKYLIHKLLTKYYNLIGWAAVALVWLTSLNFLAWKVLAVILALNPDAANEPAGAFFTSGAAAMALVVLSAFPIDWLLSRARRFVSRNGWGDNKPNYKRWVKVSITAAIFIGLALALSGCQKAEEESKRVGNFQVEKLFTYDGCTVYRFEDARTVYYTNCQGTTQYEHAHPNGKSTTVDHYETQTVVR